MIGKKKNFLQKRNKNEVTNQIVHHPTIMDKLGSEKLESINRQKNSIAQQYFGQFQSFQYPDLNEPKVQENELERHKNSIERNQETNKLKNESKQKVNQAKFKEQETRLQKNFFPPVLPSPPNFKGKEKIEKKSESFEQKFNSFQNEIDETKKFFEDFGKS